MSSRIEGTVATLDEVYAYEALGSPPSAEDSARKEVYNYVRALDYGLERLASLPLSLRMIRELHQLLMEGVRGENMTPGEFRRTQNWIGPPGSTVATARYVPPPVDEMQVALNELERFIHEESDLPKLVRAGLIHYQFEAIHPFLDGNGRIGRLLVVLLLVAWEILPQPSIYLSAFIEARRQEYYDRLLAVSQNGEWEEWLIFFLEGLRQQAIAASERLRVLVLLRSNYVGKLEGERMAKQLVNVVDLLFEQPIVSVRQMESKLGVAFTTAQRYIERLEELSIVTEITGHTRNRLYRANQIIDLLTDAPYQAQ
jgi:Fic family protein